MYDHKKIEKKWQERWEKEQLYQAEDFSDKKKFYCLIEFPYPSGDGLHVGHPRSYTALDIIARKKRMQGYNVLYPIGFDAFGLPSENYAIKTGIHPSITTKKNIATFTKQLKSLGFSFDWSRAVTTTDPEYYKWTQWIFLKLYEHGLAYKAKMPINWCLSCKIGLANEEVVNGQCERCGGDVEKREKEQWMLKITAYADKLIKDLDQVDYWDKIKSQQINWIGKSEGAEIKFKVKNEKELSSKALELSSLRVFTTRPDTLFGATYMVLAPEHKLVNQLKNEITNWNEVEEYINNAKKKSDLERTELTKEKTGVELKGIKAINPSNNEDIPVWIADYVLMGYGTGAIMAVPAHDLRDFEFANTYNLEIKEVVRGEAEFSDAGNQIINPYTGEGFMINSGKYDSMNSEKFKIKITQWLEEKKLGKKTVNYKLRDWVFSRQRYWGEPIPMYICEKCGIVPASEEEILTTDKWQLPKIEKYEPTDTGESPLSAINEWVNDKCPKCGGAAKKETDTMPNWAGSSWYFLRYIDPDNKEELAGKDKLKYWIPVDWYNGGMEHTTLHLLYSRFWYKFLYDIGVIPKECGVEPYQKRTSHGMILGKGGIKMSKSKGNVVNPDKVVQKHGADTLRMYEMFMGPFDQAIPWDEKGVMGVRRFLEKIYKLSERIKKQESAASGNPIPYRELDSFNPSKSQNSKAYSEPNQRIENLLHKTIKKVANDIENLRFNTAISALMILINEMEKQETVQITNYQLLITLLSPFAPHIAEELWSKLGNKESIFKQKWPEHDEALAKDEEIELVIQINGKVRDKILVNADISEEEAKTKALATEKIQKWLDGKEPKKVIFVKEKLVSIVI